MSKGRRLTTLSLSLSLSLVGVLDHLIPRETRLIAGQRVQQTSDDQDCRPGNTRQTARRLP